ncbi:MAG: hypothetical protein ACI4RJ_02145 [Alphaproteobacteria bacterium]
MPQFGFYPAQIFWLCIAFGVLFVAMQFFLLPPVARVLKERQEKIQELLNEAEKTSEQVQSLTLEYQRKIDRATRQSSKMLQQAHEDIALEKAKQEEELLDLLKQDLQKAKYNLKNKEQSIFKNMAVICRDFIESVGEIFYGSVLPEKELNKKIKKKIREFKDAD